MRFLWAGPWNEQSLLAQQGVAIVAAWHAAGHVVDVARTETGFAKTLTSLPSVATAHYAEVMQPETTGGGYDGIIVNVTDDPGASLWAPWLMTLAPAILVLHNRNLDSLASACARERSPAHRASGVDIPSLAGPALAVVLPDAAGIPGLQERCRGPVAVMACGPDRPDVVPAMPRPLQPRPGMTVATLCDAQGEAEVRQVVLALAAAPGLAASHTVLGPLPPSSHAALEALAQRIGSPPLQWFADPQAEGGTGTAPSGESETAALAAAQVICCMVAPGRPQAFPSLVRALATGRPVIVPQGTATAALPEGLAAICPTGSTAGHIAHLLQTLADDPAAAARMADRAAAQAAAMLPPAEYAQRLLDMMIRAVGETGVLQARMRIGSSLAELGLPADSIACARAGRGLTELLQS